MTKKSVDVVGVGTAVVDYVGLVEEFPGPDSQVELTTFTKQPGGNVATALVTLSKLGSSAAFIGKFGDDELANYVKTALSTNGIDLSASLNLPGGTIGFAFIIVEAGSGRRTILWTNEGKVHLTEQEVDENVIANCACLHLDHYSIEPAIMAARIAKKHGVPVVLDAESLPPRIDELLPMVDMLITSADFAREYSGHSQCEPALDSLMEKTNAHTVVITDGERGSYCLDATDRHHQPAFDITPIDTTGCGDVYHGAFIHGTLRRWPLAMRAEFASAAAALNARGLGGQSGIPDSGEVQQFLKTANLRK